MTDIGYLFLCGTLGTTVTTWLTVSHYDIRWRWLERVLLLSLALAKLLLFGTLHGIYDSSVKNKTKYNFWISV